MNAWRQFVLCREGWYYLFVLSFVVVGALLRDINLLVIVAGMLCGPLLFSAYSVLTMLRGVRVERRLPPRASAGDLLVVDLAVHNGKRRRATWAVTVVDQIRREGEKGGPLAQPGVFFPLVPAQETTVRSYTGRLPQRGRYRLGPLRVSTRFPLGLMKRTITVPASDTMVVFPRLGRLTPQWQRLHRQQAPVSQQSLQHRGANEGEFFGLRDYRSGDSRRWIHWRTSARRGELVVRQYEQPRNEDLLLVLDLWQAKAPSVAEQAHVELAVSFTATVAADICRQGASQVCVALGGTKTEFIAGPASNPLLDEILTRLATVEATAQDRLLENLAGGMERGPLGAPLIVVTTRPLDLAARLKAADVPASLAGELSRRRVETIDVSSARFDEYFSVE